MKFKLIALLAITVMFGLLIWRNRYLENENDRLEKELKSANYTIEQLDNKFELETKITKDTDQILQEVRKSNDKTPIAPVLDNAIDAIERLSNDSQ